MPSFIVVAAPVCFKFVPFCLPMYVPAAERVEAEGDVATAFTLARIISNIPLARGGPGSLSYAPL